MNTPTIAHTLACTLLLALPLAANEIDPSQMEWLKHYDAQVNIPKPADMLLNTDTEPDLKDGFVEVFNGKDLSRWTIRGGKSSFEVKDGAIVSTCLPDSPSTYLCTERSDYGDFIFTFETKFEVETNSGMMFRAPLDQGKDHEVNGPQVEMEPPSQKRDWSGGIYGQACGGWFYPLWLTDHEKARNAPKPGEWNRVTILAKGPDVKTWINGVPIAHWQTKQYLKGYFGLQMHKGKTGVVLWRNLRIKEL